VYSECNFPLQISEEVKRKFFKVTEKAKSLSSKELDKMNEVEDRINYNSSDEATPLEKKDKSSENIHYSNEGFEKASSYKGSDKNGQNEEDLLNENNNLGNEKNRDLQTPPKHVTQKEFVSTEASNSKANIQRKLNEIITERCKMENNDIKKFKANLKYKGISDKIAEKEDNNENIDKLKKDLAKFFAFEINLNNYIERSKELLLPLINISIFKYFDIKNQNYLTRNEIEKKLEELNINFNSFDISLLFSYIDKNCDEKIDQSEFYDFII